MSTLQWDEESEYEKRGKFSVKEMRLESRAGDLGCTINAAAIGNSSIVSYDINESA